MGILDRVASFLALPQQQVEPVQARGTLASPFDDFPDLATQLANIRQTAANQPVPIAEALGVPAIQRAVALISNTTGSLAMQGFRDGMPMTETPRILARPDPYQTPRDAYWSMAYQMATRGETVQWIARRDIDGSALSLVTVPLLELSVEDNPRNRLFPIYKWGNITSTRYSPANPTGDFVHVFYFKEPGALRGVGPLQMCGAAVTVSVEAQQWAANFFAEGAGIPSIGIQAADFLDPTADPDTGLTEADLLRQGWMANPGNQPKVYDENIKEIKEFGVNPQGAQMLDAREHQNGDASRMFGINGALLEYNSPGSSLTYQNIAEVYTDFVRTCLSIGYLEPIEQAMSDLMSRSTVARFYIEGFLRADIKTRYEVYASGITSGVLTVERAQELEGERPGSIEVAPVAPSQPQAVPTSIPQYRSGPTEVFCKGTYSVIRQGVKSERPCKRRLGLLVAPYEVRCPHCKTVATASAPPVATVMPRIMPPAPVVVRAEPDLGAIVAAAVARELAKLTQGPTLTDIDALMQERFQQAQPRQMEVTSPEPQPISIAVSPVIQFQDPRLREVIDKDADDNITGSHLEAVG